MRARAGNTTSCEGGRGPSRGYLYDLWWPPATGRASPPMHKRNLNTGMQWRVLGLLGCLGCLAAAGTELRRSPPRPLTLATGPDQDPSVKLSRYVCSIRPGDRQERAVSDLSFPRAFVVAPRTPTFVNLTLRGGLGRRLFIAACGAPQPPPPTGWLGITSGFARPLVLEANVFHEVSASVARSLVGHGCAISSICRSGSARRVRRSRQRPASEVAAPVPGGRRPAQPFSRSRHGLCSAPPATGEGPRRPRARHD